MKFTGIFQVFTTKRCCFTDGCLSNDFEIGKDNLHPHNLIATFVSLLLDCYKVNDVDTYVTIEEQEIFNSCYPDIVEQYQLKLEDKMYKKRKD